MQSCREPHKPPTGLTRSISTTREEAPTLLKAEYKYLPNFSTTSNSWDVRHLDKFLSTSRYSQKSSSPSRRRCRVPLTISSPKASTDMDSQKHASISTGTTPKAKESHFMRNNSKDSKVYQQEYMYGIYKDFCFKGVQNDFNPLALRNEPSSEAAKTKYVRSQASKASREFDPTKLEFAKQIDSGLKSPKQRRLELEETKAHQQEFQKWSENARGVTKLNRICKNGFKSGVLGFDSPVNADTVVYKDEKEKLQAKQNDIGTIEDRRVRQLSNWSGTSPAVEFLNAKFDEEAIKPPSRVVEKNIKRLVTLPHVEEWKDSGNRLFGDVKPKISEKRKEFLVRMDSRGKDWDIISAKVEKKICEQSKGYEE